MVWVAIGVQQQHSHGFDVLGFEFACKFTHSIFIQRFVQRAIRTQTLRHFVAQRAGHQWLML